ncbi:hypothetical protein TALC_00302 [Thermoplasmatales archaeon BRNA1]|nr:hypothetical protein TALC_00302 [Thermoplasmatales archaeon BRNA1]
MVQDIEQIVLKEKKNRIKWGFIWVILIAIFWGIGYVPMATIWCVPEIDGLLGMEGDKGYLGTSLLISALQAIVFMLFLTIVWCGATGKLKEYKKTISNKKIVKWILIGAAFGGPCAIFGSTIAIGYIGAGFAAAMGLMSAITGALFARIMNKEKLSTNAILGIIILLIGGIIILDPSTMVDEIKNGSAVGYIGALMSIIGWGLEGNFAVRSLDVTDSDASLPVRYTLESLLWICIILPISIVIFGPSEFIDAMVDCFTNAPVLFWEFMAAMTLGMCYVCQYRSFATLGVGRTLSIQSFYVPVSLIALYFFMGQEIGIMLAAGSLIAVFGMFVMYRESSSIIDSTRDMED